jgi:hypothetical protein
MSAIASRRQGELAQIRIQHGQRERRGPKAYDEKSVAHKGARHHIYAWLTPRTRRAPNDARRTERKCTMIPKNRRQLQIDSDSFAQVLRSDHLIPKKT